jgi:tetratricopeptide (TPR) repeat protein
MIRALFVLALSAVPLASQQSAQPFSPTEAEAWREDLRFLASELPKRHPKAFYQTPEATFDSAVVALDRRMPTLARHQAIVGLMGIVALVQDGHTSINPTFGGLGFHFFPVELYRFKDGLYIRRAAPELASLVGAKVLRVGRLESDEALKTVGTVISHENDQWVKALGPMYLSIPEVVHALGINPELETLSIEVEQGGARKVVQVPMGGLLAGHGHAAGGDRSNWADMRQPGDPPLYLEQPEKLYWMKYLPESKTLYISYRAVQPMPEDPLPTFWNRVFATADSLQPERLVLDMRDNGGGNNFFNKSFVLGVIRRTWLDQPGHFFAIIGRRTFSAAQNMVYELERYTNVTFVGEPTGNAPNQYGDARPLILPNSQIPVNVSSIYWQTMNPQDPRRFVPPSIATELTSEEYRTNQDPAMRAILRRGSEPWFTERMVALVSAGDTAGAERILKEAIADPENTWANLGAEVNTLGYKLLNEQRLPQAVAIFAINTRVYPDSANVWDSYGESLERSGKRAQAIASYRKALELEPRMGSSRDALRRLGAD